MFKTIKHSKIKNTGLIYEVLIRQIITLGINNKDVKSLNIFKTHFKKNSLLYKELLLYKMLKLSKFDNLKKADLFILRILLFRKRLDNKKIKTLKYNCVKEMVENYNVKLLFSIPIEDYKTYAGIYKLFLSVGLSGLYNPTNIVLSRYHITRQLLSNGPSSKQNSDLILELFKKQSKLIKILALRQLIKNYNKKYNSLNEDQKDILKLYINNITNHKEMNEYITKQLPTVNNRIKHVISNMSADNEVIKIKLLLVRSNLNRINNIKTVDDRVYTMLNIYLLLKLVLSMENII